MNAFPALSVENLTRHFGSTRAVDGVSFTVESGRIAGFIGPNGAGKTTTMRILATLEVPTSGEAHICGFSVVDDPERVRQVVGFMPDHFGVYPYVACWEYLDFFARAYGLRGAERRDAVERTLAYTGIDSVADKPTRALSKGMRQRLSLGRALIHDPSVLILDEPAAGLDPRARIELRRLIRDLADRGKAILVSSHILTELSDIVDEVIVIEQGRLVAAGPMADIRQQLDRSCTIELVVAENPEGAVAWLQERLEVRHVERNGMKIQVVCAEGEEEVDEADVLVELVGAGFRVRRFGVRQETLEDLFLELTEGKLQ